MNVQLKPNHFEYTVLSPRFCDERYLPLLDQIYKFWLDGWSKVFAQNGADKEPNPEDFFRQDFVTAATHEGQIAAIHFYSLYDFRSDLIKQNPYVSTHFNEQFIHDCRKLGYLKMMSMESLLANPEYRKSKTGLNFTEVMASLGQHIFLNYTDAHAIFTPTRVDNKTSNSAQRIGLLPMQTNVMVHNTPIDFLVCNRTGIIPSPEPARFFVEHFWKNRRVSGELFQIRTSA